MLILPFSIFKMSVDAGECESINYNQVLVSYVTHSMGDKIRSKQETVGTTVYLRVPTAMYRAPGGTRVKVGTTAENDAFPIAVYFTRHNIGCFIHELVILIVSIW